MTVEIKTQKKTDFSVKDAAPKAPDLKDILKVDPLQQGQALLAANKKRKKQQKRAGLYNPFLNSRFVYQITITSLLPFF